MKSLSLPLRGSGRWLRMAILAAGWFAVFPAPGQTPREALPERWARFDRDGDGRITREEFMGSPEVFRLLDRNGDGVLTPRELTEGVPLQDSDPDLEVMLSRPGRADIFLQANIAYGEADGQPLRLDIVTTLQPIGSFRPAVLFLHEGQWISGHRRMGIPRLTALAEAGFVGVSVGYRLGPQARFPAALQDVKCAVRFLRAHAVDYGIDPDRIGVWGAGAGGHLAALLALTSDPPAFEGDGGWSAQSSRVQAACLWYAPSDITALAESRARRSYHGAETPLGQWLGGAPGANPALARLASPLTHVTASAPPFLIQHGQADFSLPIDQSERLHAALVSAGVDATFESVPGAGHGGPGFGRAAVINRVVAFFERALMDEITP